MDEIFKALAEESRLRILALLLHKELCVCELENCLNLKQSNISRHLATLKNCGILDSTKQAQWAYYKIDKNFIENHHHLWIYLVEKLKGLPTYEQDYERMQVSEFENICKSKD